VLSFVIVESVPFSLPVKGFTYVQIRILAAPIGNCNYMRRVGFLHAIAVPFTVLLLVFRVVALYTDRKYAVAFFGLFWLAFLANSIAASIMVKGMPIGNTPYCAEGTSPTRAILSVIGPIVHDTLIFMATAWAFMKDSYIKTNVENSFNIIVLGRHLPAFSKSLLRDGQLYFL